MAQEKVNIVIVNYNGWKDTICCIESIDNSEHQNYYNVIIIDNNSQDNSVANIEKWHHSISNKLRTLKRIIVLEQFESINNKHNLEDTRLFLIKSKKNNGFAGGNNIGIRFAQKYLSSSYTWLLNNDTKISKDSLQQLVDRMNKEINSGNKIGILGSKILDFDQPNIIQSIGVKYNKYFASATPIGKGEEDNKQYDNPKILGDYVLGASLFINNTFIEDVGLMNEEYFLYFEELDWILRGKKQKWSFGYEPKCKIWHKQGASTKLNKKTRNEISDFYQIRNRILFTKKNYSFCLPTLYLALTMSFLKRLINREYRTAMNIIKLVFTI